MRSALSQQAPGRNLLVNTSLDLILCVYLTCVETNGSFCLWYLPVLRLDHNDCHHLIYTSRLTSKPRLIIHFISNSAVGAVTASAAGLSSVVFLKISTCPGTQENVT